jgi:hypothetical protein
MGRPDAEFRSYLYDMIKSEALQVADWELQRNFIKKEAKRVFTLFALVL